ncbi:shikimate dehydrogenase [Jiangella mangrovi]|uniref:Shikimate 5-dehydrogenase n=1 Tax=Jiangella mangrovi TaxID=1524084 RepID=A0A7W9GU48_9ACTN|nr:shikimate dehydrogenase [Jiangella mangrovi]MBB5790070.1 shikimate 5-dehydrogenase [Jiangella mangrovi]
MTHDGRVIAPEDLATWSDGGRRLVAFVGVDTSGSRIHQEFPAWAARLGRPEWVLRGVDLPTTTPAATYRDLVDAIAANPQIAGAVVTSHKLRLYRAAAARLRSIDAFAELTLEVNALARRDDGVGGGVVDGFARDPLALAAVVHRLDPAGRDVVVYGAGGAGTALLLALTLDESRRPRTITVIDSDDGALAAFRATADRCGLLDDRLHLLAAGDGDSDSATTRIPEHALVVNATGLGKDRPGSPLPPGTVLPASATAWDFNYRGDLTFLADARAQGATAVDGWDYFVAGWAAALTAIAGVPFTAGMLPD